MTKQQIEDENQEDMNLVAEKKDIKKKEKKSKKDKKDKKEKKDKKHKKAKREKDEDGSSGFESNDGEFVQQKGENKMNVKELLFGQRKRVKSGLSDDEATVNYLTGKPYSD